MWDFGVDQMSSTFCYYIFLPGLYSITFYFLLYSRSSAAGYISLHKSSFVRTLSSYSNLTPPDLVNQPRPNATLPRIPTNRQHHTISTHHVRPPPSVSEVHRKVPDESHDPFHPFPPSLSLLPLQPPIQNHTAVTVSCAGNDRGTMTGFFPKNLQAVLSRGLNTVTTPLLIHNRREGPRDFLLYDCGRIAKLQRPNEHRQNDFGFEYRRPFVSVYFRRAKDDRRERTEPPPTTPQPIAKRQKGTPPCGVQ
jgi:hypothetical protein